MRALEDSRSPPNPALELAEDTFIPDRDEKPAGATGFLGFPPIFVQAGPAKRHTKRLFCVCIFNFVRMSVKHKGVLRETCEEQLICLPSIFFSPKSSVFEFSPVRTGWARNEQESIENVCHSTGQASSRVCFECPLEDGVKICRDKGNNLLRYFASGRSSLYSLDICSSCCRSQS